MFSAPETSRPKCKYMYLRRVGQVEAQGPISVSGMCCNGGEGHPLGAPLVHRLGRLGSAVNSINHLDLGLALYTITIDRMRDSKA